MRTCHGMVLLALTFYVSTAFQTAQSKSPPASPTGTTTPSASPTGNNSQSPTGATPAPQAGVTSGTLSIESTVLTYRALVACAKGMAQQINLRAKNHILVIATPADISAVVQLRVTLEQIDLLQRRLNLAAAMLSKIPLPPNPYSHPARVSPPQKGAAPKLGAGFISGTDIATLIQTLGSVTAVNESISEASGAINDATLINLVAGQIEASAIYVPSAFPPNVAVSSDLSGTKIRTAIRTVEEARQSAVSLMLKYTQALQDAQTVLGSNSVPAPGADPNAQPQLGAGARAGKDVVAIPEPGSKPVPPLTAVPVAAQPNPKPPPVASRPPYTAQDYKQAGEFAAYSSSITSIASQVATATSAIDALESSLFGGPASSTNVSTQPGSAGPSSNGALPGLPSQVPAPPLTQSSQGQQPQANNPASPPTVLTGAPIQQLLYADLLLGALLPKEAGSPDVRFLALHALESGGGQLTKSNLFLGSRNFFSGGAIATFAMFEANGRLACSGIAYGYNGYVRDENFEKKIGDTSNPPYSVMSNCKGD